MTPTPESHKKAAEVAQTAIAVAAKTGRSEAPGILKRSNSYFADPTKITRREGFNARFDLGDIELLASQITTKKKQDPESGGLIHDLHVKRIPKGDPRLDQGFCFEVIDGHRRLTAIELLISKGTQFEIGVPVKIVSKDQTEIEDLVQMFVANEGKPFLPLEECAAYTKMKAAGMTVAEICKAVGRKQMHVTSILALANADEAVKEAVKDGTITKTMAKEIATNARGDSTKQKELVAAAKAAGKDKNAKRKVSRQVEEAKQAKAKRKGRKVPKIRALTEEELTTLGMEQAAALPKLVMDAKAMMYEQDLGAWIAQDDKLSLAYAFGALQGLARAAGRPVKLVL